MILLTTDDLHPALLSVRNSPSASHPFPLAQSLSGRTLQSELTQLAPTLEHHSIPRETVVREQVYCKLSAKISI